MTWCRHCSKDCLTERDPNTSSICCIVCGKVISQDIYSEETTFVKDAAGGAHVAGHLVDIQGAYSDSHKRTLEKGNTVIRDFITKYGLSGVGHATSYYEIAVERSFTKGRRTAQVAAACLYVACREKDKPILLIEFSSELAVSVYELGTVYLQLCKLLSLQDHSFIQKPVDPSLFMHRYIRALIKHDDYKKVLTTALHLAASMKRDWIQTGRKPSGICAAAIYVSSMLHGYKFSRADVVKVVHICEMTLTKRLIEFENTEAGSLTIEEFTRNAEEFQEEFRSCKKDKVLLPGSNEVVCVHKGSLDQSGFGLCKSCYLEFCGGLDGSEPPAFQRSEMERLAKEPLEIASESTSGFEPHQKINDCENEYRLDGEVTGIAEGNLSEPKCASPASGTSDTIEAFDNFESSKDIPATADESDTLSDIDDAEVNCYLNNEEESRFKKIIWEEMNKEYMQEQAAKEAAAAAARKLYIGTSVEIREAQALAAAAAKAVSSKREKDKRRRALEAKNAKPPQTAAEAAGQVLTKKRLSSKINYDALNSLFDDEPTPKKNHLDDTASQKLVKEDKGAGNLAAYDEEEQLIEDNYGEAEDHKWNYGIDQEMYGYDYDGDDAYDDY